MDVETSESTPSPGESDLHQRSTTPSVSLKSNWSKLHGPTFEDEWLSCIRTKSDQSEEIGPTFLRGRPSHHQRSTTSSVSFNSDWSKCDGPSFEDDWLSCIPELWRPEHAELLGCERSPGARPNFKEGQPPDRLVMKPRQQLKGTSSPGARPNFKEGQPPDSAYRSEEARGKQRQQFVEKSKEDGPHFKEGPSSP